MTSNIEEIIEFTAEAAFDVLMVSHGEHNLKWAQEIYPEATVLLEQISKLDPPVSYPIAVIYGPEDGWDGDAHDWIFISQERDNYSFLTNLLVLLSVMEIKGFAVALDSYVVIGDQEDTGLSPAQRHALGDPAVHQAMCIRAADMEGNSDVILIPYRIDMDTGDLDTLEDEVELNNLTAPHDPVFEQIATALQEIMEKPLDDRIIEYMNEFYDNEEVSDLYFQDTDFTRDDAREALKKLEERDEIIYVQRIIEDGLMGPAKLYPISRSISAIALSNDISEFVTSETETAKWLTQARLML